MHTYTVFVIISSCRYEQGRVIVRAGHKGEFVYIIYNGVASVTIEYIVDDIANAKMKPGTIFGVR